MELGTTSWTAPNIGANKITSFKALHSSYRDNEGGWFLAIGQHSKDWTASQESANSN